MLRDRSLSPFDKVKNPNSHCFNLFRHLSHMSNVVAAIRSFELHLSVNIQQKRNQRHSLPSFHIHGAPYIIRIRTHLMAR